MKLSLPEKKHGMIMAGSRLFSCEGLSATEGPTLPALFFVLYRIGPLISRRFECRVTSCRAVLALTLYNRASLTERAQKTKVVLTALGQYVLARPRLPIFFNCLS